MQLPEFETAVRHGTRLLVVVINDQALGAELHGFEAEGIDETEGAVLTTPALDEVARALGGAGRKATSMSEVEQALDEFARTTDGPFLIDARVDKADISELFRRLRYGEPNSAPHQGRR